MPARGTEGGGSVVAKCHPVMGWTGRRSARERRLTRGRRDTVRKADDDLSSGILFSSIVGVATQQVALCLNWCASPGQPESTTSNARTGTGRVEYWKAQCGESRLLRLGGGKGREPLPIRTKVPTLVTRW